MNFFKHYIDRERVLLILCLVLSLAMNYILYSDYKWRNHQLELIKRNYIADVLGNGYCDNLLDKNK